LSLIPDLETSFFENPTGHMVTVKCEPWNFRGRALLVGDAAHAIVPFFGQGMNCGFEDCTALEALMSQDRSLEQVFSAFTQTRKTNADAIADMAVENFVEMRDKVGQPRFLMEKAVERILHENFQQYVSRYSLVSFSREPYRFAYDMGLIQNEILGELCEGIGSPEQVDLKKAKKLIESKLIPFLKNNKGEAHGSQTQR
jgi:kynurenine 3-monooxygenase